MVVRELVRRHWVLFRDPKLRTPNKGEDTLPYSAVPDTRRRSYVGIKRDLRPVGKGAFLKLEEDRTASYLRGDLLCPYDETFEARPDKLQCVRRGGVVLTPPSPADGWIEAYGRREEASVEALEVAGPTGSLEPRVGLEAVAWSYDSGRTVRVSSYGCSKLGLDLSYLGRAGASWRGRGRRGGIRRRRQDLELEGARPVPEEPLAYDARTPRTNAGVACAPYGIKPSGFNRVLPSVSRTGVGLNLF